MSKTPEEMEKKHYERIRKYMPNTPEEVVKKLASKAVEKKIDIPLLDTTARTSEELLAWLAYEAPYENT